MFVVVATNCNSDVVCCVVAGVTSCYAVCYWCGCNCRAVLSTKGQALELLVGPVMDACVLFRSVVLPSLLVCR